MNEFAGFMFVAVMSIEGTPDHATFFSDKVRTYVECRAMARIAHRNLVGKPWEFGQVTGMVTAAYGSCIQVNATNINNIVDTFRIQRRDAR
ncbi:MAG: hypothetical protein ACK4S3_06450 [Parvibaculum sp.]